MIIGQERATHFVQMFFHVPNTSIANLYSDFEETDRVRRQVITPPRIVRGPLLDDGSGDVSTGHVSALENSPRVLNLILFYKFYDKFVLTIRKLKVSVLLLEERNLLIPLRMNPDTF